MNEIFKWSFSAEDENGDHVSLGDTEREFVGTYVEAHKRATELADAWERNEGGLVLRIVLERRGAVIAK